jgi:hypothetical protein
LSLKITDTVHPSYIAHILWGLAETEASDNSLNKAVKRAHQHPERPFGQEIARLLEKYPHVAYDPEILQVLIWYALNGEGGEYSDTDEKDTEHQTITIDTLLQHGSQFVVQGVSNTRGRAWEALGAVLWHVPEAEGRVWEAIEAALREEIRISVRCCMIKPLTPLFNADKKRFSDSMRQLIILPTGEADFARLSPLITHACIHLFPYIFYWLPELADELVTELLESGDRTMELIGAWLVFCESFRNDAFITKADNLTALSVDHRRLMADVAAKMMTWVENGHRAQTLLSGLFFDDDEQVRKQAGHVFGQIKADEVERHKELSVLFLRSPAFVDEGFPILKMLETATCDVVDLAVEAAQRVIADVTEGTDQHKRHGIDLHQLQGLLKREYASSEGNAPARRRILDMIDLMLAQEIYGVDTILTAHDRW